MGLTIAKLAIPRKQAVIYKTPTYTRSYTQTTKQVISGDMTLLTPVTPSQNIKYYPRLYTGAPPDAPPVSHSFLCYAEVYTNRSSTQNTRIADLTKGRLLYYNEIVDTIGGQDIYKIRCEKPDGTSFLIDPGYRLIRGYYCAGIRFREFNYVDYIGNAQSLDLTAGFAPQHRETRTNDDANFEVALTSGTFTFSVEIEVYDVSQQRIVDTRVITNLDGDTYMGTGGLTSYWVCAGVDYKDKNAAQIDPSGQWYTEDKIIKTDIDVSVSWS